MIIKNPKEHKKVVGHNLVSTMRAGVLTMGSLLGRYPKKKLKLHLGRVCDRIGIQTPYSRFESLGAKYF